MGPAFTQNIFQIIYLDYLYSKADKRELHMTSKEIPKWGNKSFQKYRVFSFFFWTLLPLQKNCSNILCYSQSDYIYLYKNIHRKNKILTYLQYFILYRFTNKTVFTHDKIADFSNLTSAISFPALKLFGLQFSCRTTSSTSIVWGAGTEVMPLPSSSCPRISSPRDLNN